MNKRLNSNEQEELVTQNLRLVYYLVNKFKSSPNDDYEDLVSIGTIGLVKAAMTFDASKGTKFATYAARCITNEIYMHFRKEKPHANDVYLDDSIDTDFEGNELTLGDKILIHEEDLSKQIEQNEICEKVISIILNVLSPRNRLIMLYKISGKTQKFISQKLNISQSYVSRLEPKLIKQIKFSFDNAEQFEKVYSVKFQNHLCQISFYTNDITQFTKIPSKFWSQFPKGFKINCYKERIIITIPTSPEYFSFIALFLQELDNLP